VTRGTWACHAYGEGPCAHLCFFIAAGRTCDTEQECDTRMVAERQRLYQRIQENHAADPDNPNWAHLVAEITSPEELLGGPRAGWINPSAQSG
jgi:hypothetical protein